MIDDLASIVAVLAVLTVLTVCGSCSHVQQQATSDSDAVAADLEAFTDTSDFVDAPLAHVPLARTKKDLHSGRCVDYLYIMAHTSGAAGAGTDAREHEVEMTAYGQTRTLILPDLPENDAQADKGDLWKISLNEDFMFTRCVTKTDIQSIAIEENGSDGWIIESIITILRSDYSYGSDYEVASMDMDVHRRVDGNTNGKERRFELTLII